MDQVIDIVEEKIEEQVIELPTDLLGQVGGGTGATAL